MENEKKNITFIVNPISGTKSKEELPQLIEQRIDSTKYNCRIITTEYAGHAEAIAKQCITEGIDICVAVGGDGTVNEVARALVHSQVALGIVPCGSGNGLARHLCIPINMKGALDIINHGKTDFFDYGAINDQPFFCTCGMGFDAFVSLKFAEAGKAFCLLPGWEHNGFCPESGLFQAFHGAASVERKHMFPGNHHGPGGSGVGPDFFPETVQQPASDFHVVSRGRRIDRNDPHLPSTSSLIRFPSSSRVISSSRLSSSIARRYASRCSISPLISESR